MKDKINIINKSEKMPCLGNYKEDRLCHMCRKLNHNEYTQCIKLTNEKIDELNEREKIQKSCRYSKYHSYYDIDDCDTFGYTACFKDGQVPIYNPEDQPFCNPCEDCKKYCK